MSYRPFCDYLQRQCPASGICDCGDDPEQCAAEGCVNDAKEGSHYCVECIEASEADLDNYLDAVMNDVTGG